MTAIIMTVTTCFKKAWQHVENPPLLLRVSTDDLFYETVPQTALTQLHSCKVPLLKVNTGVQNPTQTEKTGGSRWVHFLQGW